MIKFLFSRFLLLPLLLLPICGQSAPVNFFETTTLVADVLPNEFSCNLPAPTGVNTVSTTTTGIAIAWNAVTGATAYHVKAVTDVGVTIFDGPVPGTSASVTTTPGTTVDFTICAICTDGMPSLNLATYAATTDFVILEEILAAFPANPTINPLNCETIFDLSTQDSEPLTLQVRRKKNINDQSICNLYYRYTDDLIGVKGKQNGNNYTFRDKLNHYPGQISNFGQYGSLTTDKVRIFYGETWVYTLTISKVVDPNSPLPTHQIKICANATSQGAPFEVKLLLPTPGKPGNTANSSPNQPTLTPNPFADEVTLTFPEVSETAATIQLFDLHGKAVLKESIEPGSSSKTFSTGPLAPGIYFASITSATDVQTFKIVKVK